MINPFTNRAGSLQGPATDIQPVSPNDQEDLPVTAIALYVETGGTVSFVTVAPKFGSKLRFRAGCVWARLDISMG